MIPRRPALAGLAAVACVLLASCMSPDGPISPGVAPLRLAPQLELIPSPADASAEPINRIRAEAVQVDDDETLVEHVEDVSPAAESWVLDLSVPVEDGQLEILVYVYLIHVSEQGVEEVQFSGVVGPLTLAAGGSTAPDVPLVRGPPENLLITAVSIASAPQAVRVGDTATLSAVATTSSPASIEIFWTSLDPTVLVLDGASATGVSVGTARVVASAGAFADTVTIEVLPADQTPPTVVRTVPVGGATNAGLAAPVVAFFDEELDAATVNAASFSLRDSTGAGVPATVTYADQSARLQPAAPLDTVHTYTAVLGASISDPAGNGLGDPYSWSFTTSAGASLLGSFDPGLGSLVSIAFDPGTGNVFVYPSFGTAISELTPEGSVVPPDIPSQGVSSNDIDLDFLPVGTVIDGTAVPPNSLLIYNGESTLGELYAVDKNDGTLLAAVTTQIGNQTVGGSYHSARGTFFGVNWVTDRIYEMSIATGDTLASFPVAPAGSPAFGIFFGDVEVDQGTGNIMAVSTDQQRIRVLSPTGAFLRDIDVSGVGVSGMSGIGWDDVGGVAWISTTGGLVHRLGGISPG